MSYFTVALVEVLDRMKTEGGTTRQQFAAKAGIPLSTFSGYYSGKNVPNASSLAEITSGLSEEDALRVIVAHLIDETPEGWRDRIRLSTEVADTSSGKSLQHYGGVPKSFIANMEAIVQAAQSDKHVIAFIEEFSSLMGFSAPLKALPDAIASVAEVPAKYRSPK